MAGHVRKVALVTGGGSGIGQATLLQFAKKGYNVVMTGRNKSKLEAAASLCKAQGLTDDNILVSVGDVTSPHDNLVTTQNTIERFKRIDVLVNNAGYDHSKQFRNHTLEMLDDMYKIHVRGVFDMIQKTMPHIVETKGNIINVSSAAGIRPVPHAIGYSIMKACMDHLTRNLCLGYGNKGVRVNSVNPSFVSNTDMFMKLGNTEQISEMLTGLSNDQPLRECIDAEDVAKVISFLASDEARNLTGLSVPIDGGITQTVFRSQR